MDETGELLPADDPTNFQDLLRRIRGGSEDAAWEVYGDYAGYVRRAVRRVLNPKLRRMFDSIDFVQRVWLSLFRVPDKLDFETPQQFVKFLAGMARNKVHMEMRRFSTEKHNVGREVPLDDSRGEDVIATLQPNPVDVAIAREQWELLLQDQPAHHRRILELKAEEYTPVEIGKILNLDAHTVRRFLKKLPHSTEV